MSFSRINFPSLSDILADDSLNSRHIVPIGKYWKCNILMNPHVRPLVGWLVDLS